MGAAHLKVFFIEEKIGAKRSAFRSEKFKCLWKKILAKREKIRHLKKKLQFGLGPKVQK